MSGRTLREKGGGGGEDLRPPSEPGERVPKRRECPTYSTSNVHAYWPLCHTAVPGEKGTYSALAFPVLEYFTPWLLHRGTFQPFLLQLK